MELAIVIVGLLVLGSWLPKRRSLAQEIATLKSGQHLDLPYTNEDIKVTSRILGAWRVEHVIPYTDTLIQHFEVLE